MRPPVGPVDSSRLPEVVRAQLGISLTEARAAQLERAVGQAAVAAGFGDAGSVYELLASGKGGAAPLDALVAALNVGETYFFRDAGQIRALERRILPDLIARRSRQRRLRIWSAGCSTGEEAYTLAILVHRLLPDPSRWQVLVLGTDINGLSLRRARRGVYRAWSLRGMPELMRSCYLRPHGQDLEVAPGIRAMVRFARLNLAGDGYPSPATNTHAMDLIVCRNVLLYFGEPEAQKVLRRLRSALREDGWLLLGQVEAGLRVVEGLDRVDDAPAAFRRSGGCGAADASGFGLALAAGAAVPPDPVLTPAAQAGAAVLAGGGAAVLPGGAADQGAACAQACAEAVRFWRHGRYREALAVLAGEANRSPLLPHIQYLYGLVLLDCGKTAAALAAFRRCTYADPGFVLGHLGQAGVLMRAGQRRRAGAALDNAARLVADLDPHDAVWGGALLGGALQSGALQSGALQSGALQSGALQGGAVLEGAVLGADGPRVAEVCELIAAQRRLLEPAGGPVTGPVADPAPLADAAAGRG